VQPQGLEFVSRVLSVCAQWGNEEALDKEGCLITFSVMSVDEQSLNGDC
jgi:hypothetical protein